MNLLICKKLTETEGALRGAAIANCEECNIPIWVCDRVALFKKSEGLMELRLLCTECGANQEEAS
jgi:hypothetical protein